MRTRTSANFAGKGKSKNKLVWRNVVAQAGLKITAGQQTVSGQNGDLTGLKLHSPVMLTGHVMLRRSHCSFLNKQSNPQLQILNF